MADDLFNPDVFHVEPPLWFIGKPNDPEYVVSVVSAQGNPKGPLSNSALLFTDEDLAERCLGLHFSEDWKVGQLDGREDVVAYLMLAKARGLHHVTFDPGVTMRLSPIALVLDKLREGS